MIFFRSSHGRLAVPAKTVAEAARLIQTGLNSERYEVTTGHGLVYVGEFEGERLIRMIELAEAKTVDFVPAGEWIETLKGLLDPRWTLVG